MTELEQFEAMLDRAGIKHQIELNLTPDGSGMEHSASRSVQIMNDGRGRVGGYSGFFGNFHFDEAGRLMGIDFWE